MIFHSVVQQRGLVPFPAFMAERVYMRPFVRKLPADLSRWQPTVDAMLRGIESDAEKYLMIDQGIVPAGATQRRPGLHIDGYWHEALRAHGGGGHGSISAHGHNRHDPRASSWADADFADAEAILLASDVHGSRALVGAYSGPVGNGGDCSHIDASGLASVPLRHGIAYAGNVTMLHESLPLMRETPRTLVRINVPGWTPPASDATEPLAAGVAG